ncbi:hypothetical protein QO017_004858 [Methylobacterium gregans]|nr:hypothetical protein [Methylobacterium gregans]
MCRSARGGPCGELITGPAVATGAGLRYLGADQKP